MCTVELYRERRFAYSGIAFTAELDGVAVGRLRSGDSIRFCAEAGEHELCIYSFFGCIGRVAFTVAPEQQNEYITALTSSWSHKVTFAHGVMQQRDRYRPDAGASAALWVLILLILIPLLLYLSGVIHPSIVFFPLP
uniref:Uncharacterized protein n=1 Tax=Siphoviridae sp. ctSMg55 TaxID=2825509 RepID=A0A8S5V4N4_9CAUD|nr:MAG TPA: Protein of unknown function (DUF2846) [Siphoviridae sp. ctSMg55]